MRRGTLGFVRRNRSRRPKATMSDAGASVASQESKDSSESTPRPSPSNPTTKDESTQPVRGSLARFKLFAGDIKIAHTVFALPFALLSAFLAANGWPKLGQLGLILLCMVTARTVAMASNRLLDAEIDKT